MRMQSLFVAGELGYASYRIPTIITLPKGRVLAFCEGRVHSSQDCGTIHVLMRMSVDGGFTFSSQRIIARDGENTIGNPCPVYDKDTGILWLLLNGNQKDGPESEIMKNNAPRTVLITYSKDMGDTWAPIRDITTQLKKPGWTWYANGPCHAIQMKSGRLVVPCNHAVYNEELGNSDRYVSHVIYSDDHGETWNLGGDVGDHTNECVLEELEDGRLYINMRSYHQKSCRAVAYSDDGGCNWSPIVLDATLVEPVCQGSVIAYPYPALGAQRPLIFSNPAHAQHRLNLSLRISLDGGLTWEYMRTLFAGHAAYSDLAILQDGQIGCLYECGQKQAYERIDFSVFPLEWITKPMD